jgi:hypothetical protein
MSARNCIVPIRVRLQGIPGEERLAEMSEAIARAIAGRLRAASRAIAAREGWPSWRRSFAAPEIRFGGPELGDALQRRIVAAVEAGIAGGIGGGPGLAAPAAPPLFQLAQYSPQSAQPAPLPATTIKTTDDAQALAAILGILDRTPDGPQRREAIAILVALAIKDGPVAAQAAQRLRALLSGEPNKNIDDHQAAIEALKSWTASGVRAYDLLLYGRLWYADHSKGDLGSGLALDVFRTYLHYAGGRWAIAFLHSRITGKDRLKANLAARIVADLLEGESDPAEAKYRANYTALRAMAQALGWESFGPLGMASATGRIFTALAALRQQAEQLRHMVDLGPIGDPWQSKDVESLTKFRDDLGLMGFVTTKDNVIEFSAENREEVEHRLLFQDATKSAEWLQEMALAYEVAVDAGARLQDCTEILHANARVLDRFLGAAAAQSRDERLALFDLRHEYIDTWLALPGPFRAGETGLAAHYQSRLDMVQYKFENFDQVVAQRKFRTAREQFQKYYGWWNEGNERYPGNDLMNERFFFTMRRILDEERKELASGFSLGFATQVGGRIIRLAPDEDYAPTDLRMVSRLALSTSFFGFQAGVFLIYATNLSVHNMMLKVIESEDFKKRNGAELSAMRAELEQIWNNRKFDDFLNKSSGYEATLKRVIEAVKDRARLEILLNLAITIIAALLTEGASLAVELATWSETLAIARSAEAIASFGTLTEIGVFTASELSLQKAFFGKDITVTDVAKSALTNLLFFGALKGIGKYTERFLPNSAVGALLVGHLVGFSGVAAVSALMTKIQTGQWPQNVAEFLVLTATTYVLIAGLHAVFEELVVKPAVSKVAAARLENLKVANDALFQTFRERVEAGSLNPKEFEAMKAERIRLLEETRAVAQALHDANVITQQDLDAVNRAADDAVADAANAKFPLVGVLDPVVLALPAPESVGELTQFGSSNTYTYDPAKPRTAIDALLARYRERGFTVRGTGELIQVVDPAGRTRFVLSAVPLPSRVRALPAPSAADAPSATPLSRATGLAEPRLSAIRDRLAKINGQAEAKLPAEYPDHTVVATLQMLTEQISVVAPNWSIDAVRGLADALALERGVSRNAVRRLFTTIEPAALPRLLEAYHDVVNSPKVTAGSDYLIGADLLPGDSAKLIAGYRELQRRGIELPSDMDLPAVRGLLKEISSRPGRWVEWLAGIPKAERGRSLRAASGLTEAALKAPTNLTALLARITQEVPGQAGLNPLSGANGEAFVAALEARAGQKFADSSQRVEYVARIDNLRQEVGLLEQGFLSENRWQDLANRADAIRRSALQHLALSLPPSSPPLLTPRGDLTPAGRAFVRNRFGHERIDRNTGAMNPQYVSDLSDDQLNQQFSHEWKWVEEAIKAEVSAEWTEIQREAARRGTPLDPRQDFVLLEGRTFNKVAERLQEAARVSGRPVDTTVLEKNTGDFIDERLQANDPSIKAAYELCEKTAAEARAQRASEPPGRGRRPRDFADHWADELRAFRRGSIGAKKPDILESMLSQNQIVVTDPTLAYGDPVHNFKLAVYRAVIEQLVPKAQVGATDIRALLRQTLAGP